MLKLGTNVFEIIFPNLKVGKHQFEITLDKGTYILKDNIILGVGKIDFNLFLFGGANNIPYNVLIFNPTFSLSNITNVISTLSNFIGVKGTEFTLNDKIGIDVVIYINEFPRLDIIEPKLLLLFDKIS